MSYNKQNLSALIQLDPSKAKETILDAYKEAKCSIKDAAGVLGCSERTLHRWVDSLNLHHQLGRMKVKAQKEGWHHDHSRQGGRPFANRAT